MGLLGIRASFSERRNSQWTAIMSLALAVPITSRFLFQSASGWSFILLQSESCKRVCPDCSDSFGPSKALQQTLRHRDNHCHHSPGFWDNVSEKKVESWDKNKADLFTLGCPNVKRYSASLGSIPISSKYLQLDHVFLCFMISFQRPSFIF